MLHNILIPSLASMYSGMVSCLVLTSGMRAANSCNGGRRGMGRREGGKEGEEFTKVWRLRGETAYPLSLSNDGCLLANTLQCRGKVQESST